MRRSAPLIYDQDKFQPFSISFSMKIEEVQELIESVVFTCKKCGREYSFKAPSISDYVNAKEEFHVFYSFVRKFFGCSCSQNLKDIRYFVNYKFKPISDGQWTLIEREKLRREQKNKERAQSAIDKFGVKVIYRPDK